MWGRKSSLGLVASNPSFIPFIFGKNNKTKNEFVHNKKITMIHLKNQEIVALI